MAKSDERRPHLLSIGKDRKLKRTCEDALKDEGWDIDWVQNGLIGLESMSVNEYDVAVVADSLPLLTSGELVQRISEVAPFSPVVAIVESDERRGEMTQDFEAGLYSYLEKPFSLEQLGNEIQEAFSYRQYVISQKKEARSLLTMSGCKEIVGRSPAILKVYDVLLKIATTDVTVAIYGESGTGKELVARFLHAEGPRRRKPFVSVNCAAIPHDLLESELFGHEKGAFTGAGERKQGKFEVANKGTLFLDEIGDMSLSLQSKILKVLERGEFERVGGTETISVDVRLISATNANLEKRIETGEFRADLFHRINVFPVYLPPLRAREEDISLIAYDVLSRASKRHGKRSLFLKPDALEFLSKRRWDGNVRELEHFIERAVLLADGPFLGADDFGFGDLQAGEGQEGVEAEPEDVSRSVRPDGKPMTLKEIEKTTIEDSVRRNEGNLSKTASELGISRTTLYRKIKEHGIERDVG